MVCNCGASMEKVETCFVAVFPWEKVGVAVKKRRVSAISFGIITKVFCILAKNNDLMNTFEEKRNLLLEMIAFSTVDGQLHKREYDFLLIVAQELNIDKAVFNDLFHQELPQIPIKTEFGRIQQFYRLALLMHCDGVLHPKEDIALQQITLTMGLNPVATRRILKIMKKRTTPLIDPQVLLEIFQEQHN